MVFLIFRLRRYFLETLDSFPFVPKQLAGFSHLHSCHNMHVDWPAKILGLAWLHFSIAVVLADPGLIGPNPFPSSSVVRFFPIYLLMLLVALRSRLAVSPISLRWDGA